MLTTVEKLIFIMLGLIAIGATISGFIDMYKVIMRGQRELYLDKLPLRLFNAGKVYLAQTTTLKTRRLTSLIHLGVVWGFTFYFLVNAADVLEGFIPNYFFLEGTGVLRDGYLLVGDILSVAVLGGVAYLMLRRFVLPAKKELKYHDNVLLHPKVKAGGINRDSVIVGSFILLHVGARFVGQSVQVADAGGALELARPFASAIAPLWAGLSHDALRMIEHLCWWVALGGILVFSPYFPYTKHAHIFMAPLNFLTRPRRTSLGEMEKLNLDDENIEQFGANKLEDLTKSNIFDSFACIMCNRCQDVCPAYTTGKELSPSAYEINKRYMIKDEMISLANGEASINPLMGFAISESAVWACTSCGACIDICPVGNEPMLDILDIRRDAVMMQSEFPKDFERAFKGMERQGNPWGNPDNRFAWANGLDIPVPTVEENPDFDILYWVGCAPSYDPRAQLTARALVKVLNKAGINFAVLGEQENCTGDSARRAGREDLYQGLAEANVEILNEVIVTEEKERRIVVTCPHCYHNIGREYPQFGGDYEVVHHTELINELIEAGRLPESARAAQKTSNVTFHDPCYLGRHNDVVDEPRDVLEGIGVNLIEMPRTKKNSFCCGAGGAQFWKEEEHGTKAVNVERYEEAVSTGAEVLAVGCPFCMQMFESAQSSVGGNLIIKDVVELVAENL